MKILHLTIKQKWFNLIASGKKPWDYRKFKEFWIGRLEGRTYDEIWLYAGGYHSPTAFDFLRCKWNGWGIAKYYPPKNSEPNVINQDYAIDVSEILEVRRKAK